MIAKAANLIKSAKRIVVLTGAGVSKESGVPTFRDAQTGLWAKYNPEELATPQAFQANPKLVWIGTSSDVIWLVKLAQIPVILPLQN